MTLQYRDANIEDLTAILEIYNSTVAGRTVTADTEPVTIESRLNWFHQHEPVKRPLWIVEEQNNIIGWVSYQSFYGRPAYQETAEISIYLYEHTRGKGYGKEILQHGMNACEKLGIKTLLGFIFGHNEPSIKLFAGLGFEEWGMFPRVAKLDGIERDLIILGKRINQ
ncbi:MAG: N-acetyltransferase [Chitinophagaceae bacterium]|nr:N-acetyltransferase [Chitinophagaceae bacterium]